LRKRSKSSLADSNSAVAAGYDTKSVKLELALMIIARVAEKFAAVESTAFVFHMKP
jgi:hypothetical protein